MASADQTLRLLPSVPAGLPSSVLLLVSGRGGGEVHTSSGVAGWLELMYDHRVSTWHTGCAQMVAAVAYPLVVWQLACGPESIRKSSKSRHPCLLSQPWGKVFSFSPLSIMLAVGFFLVQAFYEIDEFPFLVC